MPFDGNGNWTSPFFPIDDRDNAIPISATKFQTLIQDNLKQSFQKCMTIDSQTKPTANIDANNFKVINIADPVLPKDAVNKQSLDAKDALNENNLWIGDENNLKSEISKNNLFTSFGLGIDLPINDVISYVDSITINWYGKAMSSDNTTVLSVDFSTPVSAILAGSPTNATRHMFVGLDINSDVKAEFTDDVTGSTGLSVITGAKRRVLSIRTDGVGNIIPFTSFTLKDGSIKIVFNSSIGNNPNSQENSANFRLLATGCPADITTTWQGLISATSFTSTSGSNFCGVEVDTTLKATATGNSYFVFASRLYGTKDNTTRVSDLVCVNGDIWYKGFNVNGGNHYVTQSGYIDERKV